MIRSVIIVLLVYIVPVYINYIFIGEMHSKNGILEHCDVEPVELFIALFPIVNAVNIFVLLLLKFTIKYKDKKILNKLFKVKK